jgi:hypothetical protein
MKPTTDRLADPSKPLSVDEMREYKGVRSVVYLLRYRGKKASVRAVARVFQALGDGMRTEIIMLYLRRLVTLESLKNQGGKHLGNTWETERTYDGNDSKHDGKQVPDDSGNGMGNENRVSSLTGNRNINDVARARADGKKERDEGDEANDLAGIAHFITRLREETARIPPPPARNRPKKPLGAREEPRPES